MPYHRPIVPTDKQAHKHKLRTMNHLQNMRWARTLCREHIQTTKKTRTHKAGMTQLRFALFTPLRGFFFFFFRLKKVEKGLNNYASFIVSHTQSDKGSALMSLLLNPVVRPSCRLSIWGQFSPRWWVCSGMLCLFVSDWPPKALRDSDSTTSAVPDNFSTGVSRIFM